MASLRAALRAALALALVALVALPAQAAEIQLLRGEGALGDAAAANADAATRVDGDEADAFWETFHHKAGQQSGSGGATGFLDETKVPLGCRAAVAPTWDTVLFAASAPRLDVTKKRVIADSSEIEVHVAWSALTYLTKHDWIGVFACEEPREPCSPLGKYPVQFKPQPGKHSSGEAFFRILVHPGARAYRVAFISPSVAPYPEVLAMTPIIVVPETLLERPRHVRVSQVVDDPLALRFIWAVAPAFAQDPSDWVVRVSAPDNSSVWAEQTPEASFSFGREDLCETALMPAASVGFLQPGTQLVATVRNVSPRQDGRHPTYVIENRKRGIATAPREVRAVQRAHRRTQFVVFGDMGQSMKDVDGSMQHSWDYSGHGELGAYNTTRLVAHLLEKYPELSLVNHIGDISYATGALALWDNFLHQIENVSAAVSYMTCIGNHEMGWSQSAIPGTDSQGECGIPYATYFPFAGQPPAVAAHEANAFDQRADYIRDQPWYSFDHGLAHITMISTEHELGPQSQQYAWIQADLAGVDRAKTPWLILMGHRPMYVSSNFEGDHDQLAFTLQAYIEPLMRRHKVDMAFWGHHHSYQRSCRHLLLNKCQVAEGSSGGGFAGTQHFVVGAGGFAFSALSRKRDPKFDYAENRTWGAALVDIVNATSARVDFHSSRTQAVIDSSWLHREPAALAVEI